MLGDSAFLQPNIDELVGLLDTADGDHDLVLDVGLLGGLVLSDGELPIALEVQHVVDLVHVDLVKTEPYFDDVGLTEYVSQGLWHNAFGISVYFIQ